MIGDPMLLSLVTVLGLCVAALGLAIRANRRLTGAVRALQEWLAVPDRGAAGPPPAGGGDAFDALSRSLAAFAGCSSVPRLDIDDGERRYRAIFEQAMEGIYQSTPDGRLIEVNEAMVRLFGFDSAEQMKASVTDIATQLYADPDTRATILKLMMGQGEVRGLETRARRRDGAVIWIQENSRAVRDATGAVLYFEGTVQDITARKGAAEKLRAILSALPDLMFQVDADGVHLDCHVPAPDLLAVLPDQVLGRRIDEVLPPDVAGPAMAALATAIRTGQVQTLEYAMQTWRGELRHFESRIAPLQDAGALLLTRDITARRRAEEVLRESEQRYRLLADNATDLITLHTPDAVFRYSSPASRRLLGYAPEELVGRDVYELFHPRDIPAIREAHKAILGDERIRKFTYQMWHKDGYWIWVETMAAHVRDPGDENAMALICVTRDVTERVKFEQNLKNERDRVREQAEHLAEAARSLALAREEAEEARIAAEQANHAKSHFLATMSHELRTPLNAILGFSEMIRDQVFGKTPEAQERYAEYAGDIATSGMHLLELINDILDISKIEAGRIEIGPEWLDLSSLLTVSLRLVRARAEERGLRLGLVLSKPLPRLCADERAVRQIVANLLSNAIKFTRHGGWVELRAGVAEPDMIEIAVADSGIGIPPEQIERVLQPFEQIDNRYNRSAGGTGLGLALVKSLAELHGGSLRIDSEVDRGTTVTVTLPKVPKGVSSP